MAQAIDPSSTHGADIVGQILLIPVDQIEVGKRLREVDPVHAQALGLAMRRDGQNVSIQVCRLPGATKWRLVDGAHRHAGAQMEDMAYLRAEVTSADRDERRLREIWAQLGHKGLSDPIDRAAWGEFVARYGEAELVEVFTPADRAALSAGKRVWHGRASWTDMVAATRAAMSSADRA